MTTTDCIDGITRSLDDLKPHWLPTYDLRAYAAKVDAECSYTSEMMVAMEVNAKVFEEIDAFVQLCGAFARMNPSPAPKYVRVSHEVAEIDDALAHYAGASYPTYTGLLALLVERGMLVRQSSDA